MKLATDFGANGDGAFDNYGAAVTALEYCRQSGEAVHWPRGTYRIGAPLPPLLTTAGKFTGDGRGFGLSTNVPSGQSGTLFRADFEAGDLLTLGSGMGNSSCANFEISGIGFWPVKFRNGAEIRIAGAARCNVSDLAFAFCDEAIHYGPSAACLADNIFAFNCFGGVITTKGAASIVNFSQGHYFSRIFSYNVCEFTPGRCFPDWQPARAHLFNDAINCNGWLWACTQAGTTAASGGGPVIPAFTYAGQAMATDILDGTAKWRPICRAGFAPFKMDSYSLVVSLRNSELLQAHNGIAMVNADGAGAAPTHLTLDNILVDHEFGDGAAFLAGQRVESRALKATLSAGGRGIYFGAGFQGDARISGGQSWGSAYEGIKTEAGPVNLTFDGVQVGNNSRQTANAYDGIDVASSHTKVVNCDARPMLAGGPNQRYGIRLRAGAQYCAITGNDVQGNGTGPILDEALHVSNIIENNPGTLPNQLPVTVGASPFAWTNNTGRPVSVIIWGQNVPTVTLNGIGIGAVSAGPLGLSLCVPRGQTVTLMGHTATPSMAWSPVT